MGARIVGWFSQSQIMFVGSVALAALAAGCATTDGGGSSDTTTASSPVCELAAPFKAPACVPFCSGELACPDGHVCTLNGAKFQCTAPGTQVVDKPCNDSARCATGACVVTETDGSRCFSFCDKDADCPAGKNCNVRVAVDGGGEAKLCGAKPAACDIYAQDCTGEGDGCYLGDGATVCVKAGTAEVGAACNASNDCAKSLICAGSKCLEICNPKTNGPDPKCTFKCPDNTSGLDGETTIAVCTLPK